GRAAPQAPPCYVRPRFGNWPVASITSAEVSAWVGGLVARGLAPSTATRALATLRSILAFAVADGRVQHNVAASVRRPARGRARREGQALTLSDATLTQDRVEGGPAPGGSGAATPASTTTCATPSWASRAAAVSPSRTSSNDRYISGVGFAWSFRPP